MKGFRKDGICVVTYLPNVGMVGHQHIHWTAAHDISIEEQERERAGHNAIVRVQYGDNGCQKIGFPLFTR